MVFTSVAGHLLELEFEARVRGWQSCAPRELYDAQVFKGVPKVGGCWSSVLGGRVRSMSAVLSSSRVSYWVLHGKHSSSSSPHHAATKRNQS